MLLSLYRFLGQYLPDPVLNTFYQYRVKQGKEMVTRRSERFGHTQTPRPQGFLVWIHGASVGELASIRFIVRWLLDTYPGVCVLLTSGTVASFHFVKPWLSDRCLHQFIPYDTPKGAQRFLHHWKPDLVLWVESELWPTLLHELKKIHVPAYLINGRMSFKSYKMWKKTQDSKQLLSTFHHIFAQSKIHKQYFDALGAPCVSVLGNIKLVGLPLPVDERVQHHLKTVLDQRPWFMAASTHKGEEEKLLHVFRQIKRIEPQACFVLAPRHMERVASIQDLVNAHHFTSGLYSKGLDSLQNCDVFIVDTMGILGTFYSLKTIVFLGGTLVPVGGHNFIEAYQWGSCVIAGPYVHKQQELIHYFEKAHCFITLDHEKLPEKILELWHHKQVREALIQKAHGVFEKHQHLCHDLFSCLKTHLPQDKTCP